VSDGLSDILLASAALNYVARPKIVGISDVHVICHLLKRTSTEEVMYWFLFVSLFLSMSSILRNCG